MRTKTKLFLLSALLMMSISGFAQNVRGFYLQDVGDWLGNATKENQILSYAQGNGFNYILFYDLGDINWTSTTEKNQLGAFIRKAKTTYGITQVGGVVEYAGYVSQKLIPYNTSRTSSLEKFDVINLEFEFWVTSSITSSYCSKFLNAAGMACTKAGAWQFAWRELKAIDALCASNGLISEVYLGWPDASQMASIVSKADRILLSAYRPTDSDIYTYSKQRMKDIAVNGGTTKVITLLSSETTFMGPWLSSHPQTQPYQTISAALNAETGSFKNNISLQGYQWFTYKYLPHTILATASITANGPLNFCPGGSVTLTANSGSAYLWTPGGQTTQSITVSNPGSYKVKVTNSGTAVTSSTVVVTNSGTGSAPVITASGPVAFCPGGSVTLTSTSATSYNWSSGETTQSITVTNPGSYTVSTGGVCGGTSSAVVVTNVSSPAVPVVTANSSLNVCPGTVLTLTSSQANGYLWSNGATTRSIAVSSAGDYTVKAYNGPNCFAESTPSTVNLLPAVTAPVITASGSTTLTASQPSVSLTSTSANAYSWSNSDSLQTTVITEQGSYRVTVTGANGCKATSSPVIVTANGCTPPPIPTITSSGSNLLLSGQTVTLTSSGTGGWLWSNGATTKSITVSNAGIYSVRNYNKGYCFSISSPVTVTVLLPRLSSDEIETAETNFSVYPNPSIDQINLVFTSATEETYNLKLLDISGREIQNLEIAATTGENRAQMNLADLTNGIYLAYLISGNQKKVIKVIKE